jgi:hypothetical protein
VGVLEERGFKLQNRYFYAGGSLQVVQVKKWTNRQERKERQEGREVSK